MYEDNMKIEISDEQYWKILNYDDAMLYLQRLEIDGKKDWRTIGNYKEYKSIIKKYNNLAWLEKNLIWGQSERTVLEDYEKSYSEPIWVLPVRTV